MEQKEFEPSSGRDFEGFSHFFLFSSAYVEPKFEPRGSNSSDTLKQRAQSRVGTAANGDGKPQLPVLELTRSLLQTVMEQNRRRVIEIDAVPVRRVRIQILGVYVEDPLTVGRIPAERGVGRRRHGVFIRRL